MTVRRIHGHVRGRLPDGTPYRADDPALIDWMNVSGAISFLAGYRRYVDPGMAGGDRDRYLAEMAEIAAALGASNSPRDRRAAAPPRRRSDGRGHAPLAQGRKAIS